MTIDNGAIKQTPYTTKEPSARSSHVELTSLAHSPRFAEIRVSYKSRQQPCRRHQITGPMDAACYLRSIWNDRTLELIEEFVVLYLNSHHDVLGWAKIASGGINATQVDCRLIFAIALQTASTAILACHNHPSGSTEPSVGDKSVTQQITEAGNLLGISLVDHIILSRFSSFSFRENDLL